MVNTRGFARSDLHWTDFIKVTKDDINRMHAALKDVKGFSDNDINDTTLLTNINNGDYRNGESGCPYGGGQKNGIPNSGTDTNHYFFKGLGKIDCIEYLLSFELF